MIETANGVDGAASLVDAWLEEPSLEAHAQHVRNLAAQSADAAEHLVIGLTMLAGGLAFALARMSDKSPRTVLIELSAAIKAANAEQ